MLEVAWYRLAVILLLAMMLFVVVAHHLPSPDTLEGCERREKMYALAMSGAIRGGVSGLVLGGPVIAVLSGTTLALINPIMQHAGL